MPLKSLQIKKTCSECGKTLEEVSSKVVEGIRIIKTSCGHLLFEKNMVTDESNLNSLTSQDGRKLRAFQVKRIKDVENSNGRALLNQQMGLGKTVIAAGTFKLHYNEMIPILIICKAGLKHQMFWEMHRWIGKKNEKGEWEGVISQVIDQSREKPVLKFFKVVIISFETLAQAKWVDEDEFQGAFKTVFIDECQKIKNPEAKMTKAVRKICSGKIVRKRIVNATLGNDKVQMIVNDLMTYYGLKDRFIVSYENLENKGKKVYGETEVKCEKDSNGHITGRITLDVNHCNNGEPKEVIDTILHEIAHALTPGVGHNSIWAQTALSIGADPKAVGNCDGTTEIKETEEIPQYIIAASGTPIKNNAAEYFTILNILRPDKFWNKADFERRYVDQVWDGYKMKSGGIKRHMIPHFQEATKDFIFRDTREEVEPDLPLVDRQFRYNELGEEVAKAYGETVEEFNNEFGDVESFGSIGLADRGNILSYINKMRQIVGMSKIASCVDYVEDFLGESATEKIVVFVHHIQAGNVLNMRLKSVCNEVGTGAPLMLTSDLDSDQRAEIVEKFRTDLHSRVLIASTLAAGEGLNLQFCSHCVLMERQWNPANEEQAEARFTRIGSSANKVIAMYLVATGTIDEYFSELVEKKRNYMSSALDGKEIAWDESDIMKGLFEKLKSSGKNKWKLQ